MPGHHTEAAFEAAIEECLVAAGGYVTGDRDAFDAERCIDPAAFLAFVQETQAEQVELSAAAGAFGAAQQVEPDGWVVPNTTRPLADGLFVAQVVGRSMEPLIPDGAWCLFRSPVTGRRQGRVVLVQHHSIEDPETDGSYTVKRYESEKATDAQGDWRHQVIRLLPENPDFEPIVLRDLGQGELSVIAELVEVLP